MTYVFGQLGKFGLEAMVLEEKRQSGALLPHRKAVVEMQRMIDASYKACFLVICGVHEVPTVDLIVFGKRSCSNLSYGVTGFAI